MEDIACAAGVAQEDMIGSDLFLYNRMEGSIWGAQEEFISIGRLDDLQCAFASLQAFLEEDGGDSIPVHCVYDNEEVEAVRTRCGLYVPSGYAATGQ